MQLHGSFCIRSRLTDKLLLVTRLLGRLCHDAFILSIQMHSGKKQSIELVQKPAKVDNFVFKSDKLCRDNVCMIV